MRTSGSCELEFDFTAVATSTWKSGRSKRQRTLNAAGTKHILMIICQRKGRGLTQSYDKSPYTHRKIQK